MKKLLFFIFTAFINFNIKPSNTNPVLNSFYPTYLIYEAHIQRMKEYHNSLLVKKANSATTAPPNVILLRCHICGKKKYPNRFSLDSHQEKFHNEQSRTNF